MPQLHEVSFTWDPSELLERVEGDEELLRELLVLYRDDSQKNLLEAQAALAEKDFQALSRAAHTLKGMLRNLDMTAASQIAARLEDAANQERAELCTDLVPMMEAALAAMSSQVEARLAGAQA
jgi:two-component system, sensor histidine kinase and response regulator